MKLLNPRQDVSINNLIASLINGVVASGVQYCDDFLIDFRNIKQNETKKSTVIPMK